MVVGGGEIVGRLRAPWLRIRDTLGKDHQIRFAKERPVVANKDKGGKSTKKVAAKDLKEKRQAKKQKKAAADSASRVVR